MNWQILLTSTLIATIISSLVSAIVTVYLKSREYKYDYKKYILGKRKTSYNEIEKIVFDLLKHHSKLDGSDPIHYFFLSTSDVSFLDFNFKVVRTLQNAFWFSDGMYQLLMFLNQFLVDIGKEHEATPNLNMETLGAKHYVALNKITEKICERYFKDISELDDIRKFKAKKIFY